MATQIGGNGPFSEDEVRLLRKRVRFNQGLRKTYHRSSVLNSLNVTPERVKFIEALADTFTKA